MSDEKKVVFTADDKVSGKANQIANTILSNAQKYSAVLKEQNAYINEQIKLLDKKAKMAEKDLEGKRAELKTFAPGKAQQDYLKNVVVPAKQGLSDLGKTNDLLKELLNVQKQSNTAAQKTENEVEKENKRKAKYEDLSLAKREALADKTGVRKRYAKTEKEGYGEMTTQEIERLHYQKSVVDKDKAPESTFMSMFKAMSAVSAIHAAGNMVGGMMNAPTGAQGVNTLIGGAGNTTQQLGQTVGGITGGIMMLVGKGIELYAAERAKVTEQRMQLAPGYAELGAMSGKILPLGGNTDLGYSSVQALGLQKSLMGAAGTASNIGRNTEQAQQMQRGLGLSPEVLTSIIDTMRMSRSSDDIVSVVTKVLRNNAGLARDQTQLSNVLQNTLTLQKTIAGQTEYANVDQIAKVFGQLRAVGGTFADKELGLRNATAINTALTNPQNDFQKARSFGVLSALEPGSSYFHLLEMKEKGLGQQGYLQGMLGQMKRETGGGENFALAAMTNLGIGASTARKLTENFGKGGTQMSEQEIQELVSQERAKTNTPQQDREIAEVNEANLMGVNIKNLEHVYDALFRASQNLDKSTDKLLSAINNKNKTK